MTLEAWKFIRLVQLWYHKRESSKLSSNERLRRPRKSRENLFIIFCLIIAKKFLTEIKRWWDGRKSHKETKRRSFITEWIKSMLCNFQRHVSRSQNRLFNCKIIPFASVNPKSNILSILRSNIFAIACVCVSIWHEEGEEVVSFTK